MSALARGVWLYRCIPPKHVPEGITARVLAEALGLTVRTVQRDLVSLQHAGLVKVVYAKQSPQGRIPARWWRA